MNFSVKWGEFYFNVQFDGKYAVKAFFSYSPAFNFVKSDYSEQLERYFGGERVELIIPYRLRVSDFTARVLEEVRNIPYGRTKSYAEIARVLKTSPRAVGQAVKRNPLPVIIPCHRVVGKNGLGGYTVSSSEIDGLVIKERLLKLEGVVGVSLNASVTRNLR